MEGTILSLSTSLRGFAVVACALALSACGGGAETVENPVTSGGSAPTYSGPAPATADVQAFKINVWDNLKAGNRCGQCHVEGGQAPQFVRQDLSLIHISEPTRPY